MPHVRHERNELQLKLVYYGPGLGGKTTNLRHIHKRSRPDRRGKLVSLDTESERTLFFDLLPMDLGTFRGYHVRLHLCTVPGQIARDETRRLVLRHVDGIVFVVDSQPAMLDANIESIRNLETNLRDQGGDPDRMPLVIQFNKRDLPDVLSIDTLRHQLRVPEDVTQTEASALQGWGVFPTLKHITTECLQLIGNPADLQTGYSPSILPGRRPSMYPDAVAPSPEAGSEIPAAPRVPNVGGYGHGDR